MPMPPAEEQNADISGETKTEETAPAETEEDKEKQDEASEGSKEE